MNKVILVGRLVRDPETRYTQTGKAVTNITIAVDDGFGENKKTTFVPVVAWEKIAEIIGNNLQKGRRVLVEGRLQIQDYEKDGVKKRSTDVVVQSIEFLDSKQGGQADQSQTDKPKTGYDVSSFGTEVFPEEEIPF